MTETNPPTTSLPTTDRSIQYQTRLSKKIPPRIKLISIEQYMLVNGMSVKGGRKENKSIKISSLKLNKLKSRPLQMSGILNPADDPYINGKDISICEPNSIQDTLDYIHPDIKKFFTKSTIISYLNSCHTLTIKLNTGITILIDTFMNNQKKYKVIMKKKVLLEVCG